MSSQQILEADCKDRGSEPGGAAGGGLGGVHDEGEEVDEAPLVEQGGAGVLKVNMTDDGAYEGGLESFGGELGGHPEGLCGGDDVVCFAVQEVDGCSHGAEVRAGGEADEL